MIIIRNITSIGPVKPSKTDLFISNLCRWLSNENSISDLLKSKQTISIVTPIRYMCVNTVPVSLRSKPRKTKFDKPVDWLPFPWYRRPRFNTYESSGDIAKIIDVNPSWPKPDFEFSDELKSADESTRKMFTCETATKQEAIEAYRRQVLKKVQQHPLDFSSPEVEIALRTIRIQALYQHVGDKKKETRGKVFLWRAIHKRNQRLKELRRIDYPRFEWLCEVLQLEFVPRPMGIKLERYTKKWDLRRLTREYCQKMIKEKKDAFHNELKSQQEDFMKEKAEILAWIEEEEKDLGVSKFGEANKSEFDKSKIASSA